MNYRINMSYMHMASDPDSRWTFLSNHALVLITVAADLDARVRDIARDVGITERAAQRIVSELVEAGALVRERVGRRNHYRIHHGAPLRHPLESHRTVADLLRLSRKGPPPLQNSDAPAGEASEEPSPLRK